MDDPSSWLREPARAMAPAAVLAQPVGVLQGVTGDAASALDAIGISTVLDLGAAAVFTLARQIVQAADGEGPLGAAGPLPADMIDDSARGLSAQEVAQRPIEVLRLLNGAAAGRLASALPAASVRDLGLWPPALAAMRLINIAYGGADRAADPEAPQELQPRMGRLPVDRLQYEVLLFESLIDLGMFKPPTGPEPDGEASPPPRTLPDDAAPPSRTFLGPPVRDWPTNGGAWDDVTPDFPLDLTDALLGKGYDRPGLGFLLTLQQSWYGVGLSLGHLLHSLALAPGEATRIAVVDWSRRVASATAESTSEDEALRASVDRNRSVSEITSAVNKEAQSGFSSFSVKGDSGGFSLGAGGNIKGVDVAGGLSYAGVSSQGSVAASSQGERDVAGKMTQNAHDRTEQFASLSRGRRASVVSEVSVTEAERLSTRVVANYNHMHALSVLYFEIVQLYRVVTECVAVEPLLYLPVKPLDFKRAELVDRYRPLLASVALTAEARDALLGVVPKPPAGVPGPGGIVEMRFFNPSITPEIVDESRAFLRGAALRAALGEEATTASNLLRFDGRHARLAEVQIGTVDASRVPIAGTLSITRTDGATTLQFEQWGRPPKDPQKFLPEPGDSATAFRVKLPVGSDRGASAIILELQDGWRWDESVAKAGQLGVWPSMRFVLELLDPASGQPRGKFVSFEVGVPAPNAAGGVRIGQLSPAAATPAPAPAAAPPFDLVAHLQANALHYTMALLRQADPALLGFMLSGLQLFGRPLLGSVSPVPVTTMGNYLVFRWPALREWQGWQALCKERGLENGGERRIGTTRESLVPVASGGVFAEAVLGRFNSAEKLDLTRFWNWQDSPIPILPPEIAALQAGLRQGAATERPTPLGPANLQVRDAPGLPDPSGVLAKALEIAGKGDAFRDMSGMNALLTAGGTAATLAAQNAAKFMETAMQTVSAYGARINQGKDMDKRAAEKPGAKANDPAGGTGAPSPPAAGTPPGGGPAPGGPSAPGGTPAPGGGPDAAPNAKVGGHERGAFEGPQPDDATQQAEPGPATTRRFEVMMRITDYETLDAVRSSAQAARSGGDTKRHVAPPGTRRIDCDGAIILPALVIPDRLNIPALTEITNGVGSIRAAVSGGSRRVALRGEFSVARFDMIRFEESFFSDWRGIDAYVIPRKAEAEMNAVNKVPIVGDLVSLPDDGGALTLDLYSASYTQRELRDGLTTAARRKALATILDGLTFPLQRRVRGATATSEEISIIEEQTAAYVRNRWEMARAFFQDTNWNPLIGCSLSFDPQSGDVRMRFSVAALGNVQIASATVEPS